jgi:two-component system phosphate regulon sensor histidine kinase PhoR
VVLLVRDAARRAEEARPAGPRAPAQALAEAREELASVQGRADAILAAMQEGIMVLDEDRTIAAVNPALREMLLLGADVVGKKPLEVARHAGLAELIAARGSGELDLGGVKPRRLLARASSIAGGGTLVAFFDVTELRRLESVRRDFVANVSHELRTPVTAIRSAAETLRAALAKEPAAAERFVAIIERNAGRLQELLEDLLDLSRIESRQFQLRLEPVELGPFLAGAVTALRGRAEDRDIRLETGAAAGTPPARADRRALEQVCANLVDNAIRHCPPGSRVSVRAAARGREVEISVTDDGPGIERRHLDRLFERFYRVDPGRGRDPGGTGLGLSIVKHLVEAMGGAVTVESEVGKGSTFRVVLPAEA